MGLLKRNALGVRSIALTCHGSNCKVKRGAKVGNKESTDALEATWTRKQ